MFSRMYNYVRGRPPAPPEPPLLGDKSAGVLLGMFQDFYRQEVSAEEDVHRTLPFFATALGLIIAALNYTASQLPSWPTLIKFCGLPSNTIFGCGLVACGWPVLLTGALLAVAAFAGIGVLWFLALATKRRAYDRIGPEGAHLVRVRALQEYHLARGLTGAAFRRVHPSHHCSRIFTCAGLCWGGRSSALSKVSALASSPMRTIS
jgi:hypothetical protein